MWKILEFGALRCFSAARGDCTGTVSTRVCQRADMVAVHKLLYDEYKVDNKVVFQNKQKNLKVIAAQQKNRQTYVLPLEVLP
jgi:hypothetical protein